MLPSIHFYSFWSVLHRRKDAVDLCLFVIHLPEASTPPEFRFISVMVCCLPPLDSNGFTGWSAISCSMNGCLVVKTGCVWSVVYRMKIALKHIFYILIKQTYTYRKRHWFSLMRLVYCHLVIQLSQSGLIITRHSSTAAARGCTTFHGYVTGCNESGGGQGSERFSYDIPRFKHTQYEARTRG